MSEPSPAEGDDAQGENKLIGEVRQTRRALARLLRALQASGRSVTQWPTTSVTRLAHLDSITARYLIDQRPSAEEVELALRGMQAIGRWANDGLDAADRAEVRAYELVIRIEDAALTQPLLQPGGAPEGVAGALGFAGNAMEPRSLRVGLAKLSDEELEVLAKRLGLGPLPIESGVTDSPRATLESRIVQTLRDDHLLSILLSTLGVEAQALLADLVRGGVGRAQLEELAQPRLQQAAVGGDCGACPTAIGGLRACGLVFVTGARRPSVWVPVELQPRIHGVLTGFGL